MATARSRKALFEQRAWRNRPEEQALAQRVKNFLLKPPTREEGEAIVKALKEMARARRAERRPERENQKAKAVTGAE